VIKMYLVRPLYRPLLAVIDVLGYALFWWLKLLRIGEPGKILCIRIDHVGDVLLTTPAFRALRSRFPKARIDVLVRSFAGDVLAGNRNVDRIIRLDAPWAGLYGRKSGFRSVLGLVRRLRREKYDVVIDFKGDPRNILLAFLCGRRCIGYGIRGLGFLLNRVVHFVPGNRHQIQCNLDVARALGADSGAEMDFPFPHAAGMRAKKLLAPASGRMIIGMTPAAGMRRYKYWLPERWAELADRLIEHYDAAVVITGGRGDISDVNDVLAVMKNPDKVVNLAGKTSLKELAAVVSECCLFVSPDTANAHIARALGVPLVALFGSEDADPWYAARWGYNAGMFRLVQRRRMADIGVNDVLDAITEIGVLDEA
jgi:ADP-heptose:LPS heptosyltransferase